MKNIKKILALCIVIFIAHWSIPALGSSSSSEPPGTSMQLFWKRNNNYNFDVDVEITDCPNSAIVLFWAHQFGFVDGNGGFIGLQLVGGEKKAIFSIWDAISGDSGGMIDEGGPVWRILINYDWQLSRKYRYRIWAAGIEENGDEWWLGAIYDYSSGIDTIIGRILVPASWGWLSSWSVTWVEYAGYTSCTVPYTRAVFSGHYARHAVEDSPPDRVIVDYGIRTCSYSDVDYYGGSTYVLEAGNEVVRDTPDDTTYYVDENVSPEANAGGPYIGIEGELVSFDGSSSYDPDGNLASTEWSLGDGATSQDLSPTHIYAQDGEYTVTLTVIDNDGQSASDTTSVSVSDTDPIADFSATPRNGAAPLTVEFTDTSTSYDGIIQWTWDFGDGLLESGFSSITHTYQQANTYPVTLTVTEADGDSDLAIKSDYIMISAPDQRVAPTVTIVPSSQSGKAGSTFTYTVHLTNNDPLSFGSSAFSLTSTVPSSWSATFSHPSIILSPQSTDSSVTLTVVSVDTAIENDYSLSVTATNTEDRTFSATASATYTIELARARVEIINHHFEIGSFTLSDTISAYAEIQNSDNSEQNVFVEFSVQDIDGKWWKAPLREIILQSNEKQSVRLTWLIKDMLESSGPAIGQYNAKLALWEKNENNILSGLIDYREKENAFDVFIAWAETWHKVIVNVLPGWAVADGVTVTIIDSNGQTVSRQSLSGMSGPFNFEFLIPVSIDNTFTIKAFTYYDYSIAVPAHASETITLNGDMVVDLYLPNILGLKNNVVTLKETQDKLLLHVYDSESHHIGINHNSNRIDMQIPDAFYFDFLNGTIIIGLPYNIQDFKCVVDATHAKYSSETFDLTTTILSNGGIISVRTEPEVSIQQSEFVNYDVKISDDNIVFSSSIDKLASSISCSTQFREIVVGNSVTIEGLLQPPLVDEMITIRFQQPDGTVMEKTILTSSGGSYSYTYTPDIIGVWMITSSWAGDLQYESTTSELETITLSSSQDEFQVSWWFFIPVAICVALLTVVVIKRR